MPSEWNNAVKTAFTAGRRTNKFYSLKDAMLDAKKIYKKGANVGSRVLRTGRRSSRRNRRRRTRRHRGGDPVAADQNSTVKYSSLK